MDAVPFSCEIRYAVVTIRDRAPLLGVLRETGKHYAARIVCFDAEKLAGRAHAEAALRHAHRAFARGSAISNSFEMEALLYAAGSRQCSAAVSFGLHEGENLLYVCCCPAPEGIWKELARYMPSGIEPDECISPQKAARLVALFDITPEEIVATGHDRLRDLVLERVALLDVSK
ncbi:MAG: KEOPS complex subunit Cgi121 [Methanoregula sp.]